MEAPQQATTAVTYWLRIVSYSSALHSRVRVYGVLPLCGCQPASLRNTHPGHPGATLGPPRHTHIHTVQYLYIYTIAESSTLLSVPELNQRCGFG